MLSKIGAVGITASAFLLLCAISGVNSFTKYGRGCNDIGCMPSEECVITSDSCSYSQHEGKDCGSYPTCKRKTGGNTNSAPVNPSGSGLKPGGENAIFSPSSSNPSANTQSYYNHNGHNSDNLSNNNNNNYNNNNGAPNNNNNNNNLNNGYMQKGNNGNNGNNGGGQNGQNNQNSNNQNGRPNLGIIDPHYVFGAPQSSIPVMSDLPIFPYNSPTNSPSFQQFPQPNHPGSGLSPGFPHGLQPLNPYNPSYVFGQQPYYPGGSNPGGTGGPPGGSMGILPGGGGGLAPPGAHNFNYNGGYQNPNMYNKPPPQYQNQNPYNRQTQHPASSSSAARCVVGAFGSNWQQQQHATSVMMMMIVSVMATLFVRHISST